MKQVVFLLSTLLIGLTLILTSCEKEDTHDDCSCDSHDATQMRMAMQEDGYIEIEVNPLEKIECYFEEWDKTILIPVSGLFEYYDENNIWVASIDFGDGTCDQWGTKTWDINIFPDYPNGSMEFSLFE